MNDRVLFGGLLLAMATPLIAAEPCAVTYPQFHAAVPHIDLQACPTELEGPSRFCRMVENEKGQHVFVFTVKGQQCLLQTQRFDAGAVRPPQSVSTG